MKSFLTLLGIFALAITFILGVEKGLLFLALFAASPYVMGIYLLYISKHRSAVITAKVLIVFIVSVGLYFLLDRTYMERNLGYKFSYLFMPIWQWTMLLAAGAVAYLSNGSTKDDA